MLQNCLLLQNATPTPNDVTPSQSDIIKCLGTSLSHILLQYFHPQKKDIICLPSNTGEDEFNELSYEQMMKNKKQFAPPPNDQRIKACTHEGILELGQKILDKFQKTQDFKRKFEFEVNDQEARNLFDAEKRRALELQEEKLRKEHEKCYDNLLEDVKTKLENELKKAKEQHCKQLKNSLIKERLDMMQEMMKAISDEISDIIISLCKNFNTNLINERKSLIKVFQYCLSVERDMANNQLKSLEKRRIKDLLKLKEKLETSNLANLTSLICLEKMKYNEEKKKTNFTYQKKNEILQKLINSLTQICKEKTDEYENRVRLEEEIQFYKAKILKLVKEFQKLINFTFDAIPGQANFLFDLDSFLSIANHLEHTKHPLSEKKLLYTISEVIIDSNNRKWKPKKSLLQFTADAEFFQSDFENNMYTCLDCELEPKSLIELIIDRGIFSLQFEKVEN